MPEYLAPGVFVEEVSFRSKSIEGVSTSTTGFAGMTHWGPVWYPNGPSSCTPRLITSYTEFERVYGGLTPLRTRADAAGEPGSRLAYVAHAVRAFFDNGGKRVYISRVFSPLDPDLETPASWGVASHEIAVQDITATWRARWPGEAGQVYVETRVSRTRNIAYTHETFGRQARGASAGAVVEVLPGDTAAADIPDGNDTLTVARLRVVRVDSEGRQHFVDSTGNEPALNPTDIIQLVEMRVRVRVNAERTDETVGLAAAEQQKRYICKILQRDDPEDEDAVVCLEFDPTTSADAAPAFLPARLMVALQADGGSRLQGGHDGLVAQPADLTGRDADPDDATRKATGLAALGDIDDIAIVALPDGGTYDDEDTCHEAAGALIGHAERLKYRIAIIDAPEGSSLNEVRSFRGRHDSTYAALYHPWIEITDPTERPAQGAPPKRLLLPPCGFVAGIYARNDITRGVHKAPANEVVRGLTRFEANINKGRQEVLNPEGINALRFFEGRGHRVWGARTISSDPEWKYVNVRRLFIYIEHSIDNGTQWAVFEPNNERLWVNIRRTVESFLLVLWRDGALMGSKPEEAFFVRCDRTTMIQNDLDNGRLICLIGVAPVKPAEFVIFRIGQWTADAAV
jgi:phage tail sheath protein FI